MTVRQLIRSIQEIANRTLSMDEGRYETLPPAERPEVYESLRQLCSEAEVIYGRVLDHYKTPNAIAGQDDLVPTSDEPDADESTRGICEIAFCARWELRTQRQATHEEGAREDVWTLVGHCSRVRRIILRSTIAIEMAMCEHSKLPSRLAHLRRGDLEKSLHVRREYAFLRRILTEGDRPNDEAVVERLRNFHLAIGQLAQNAAYQEMRVSDRASLRQIETRLNDFFRGSSSPGDRSRLWADCQLCCELFLEVNKRELLASHDRDTIDKVYVEVFAQQTTPERMPEVALELLDSLVGRDEELDALLLGDTANPVERWRGAIERVRHNMLVQIEQSADTHPGDMDTSSLFPLRTVASPV